MADHQCAGMIIQPSADTGQLPEMPDPRVSVLKESRFHVDHLLIEDLRRSAMKRDQPGVVPRIQEMGGFGLDLRAARARGGSGYRREEIRRQVIQSALDEGLGPFGAKVLQGES